ncbi:hypothetical protein B0H19DRAFT_1156183 [Mycena capillaripes]|nr:hypothetical protein B0H19DRAFT_1156183 [Mycena capillaripes]
MRSPRHLLVFGAFNSLSCVSGWRNVTLNHNNTSFYTLPDGMGPYLTRSRWIHISTDSTISASLMFRAVYLLARF